MIYYLLHIFGTDQFDCKFMFTDRSKLTKYLERLPLEKHTYDKKYLTENEEHIYRYEQATVEGQEALKWWESKIMITKIDTKQLPRYHKYFPAPFWDELPEKHRERIFR